MTIINNLFKTLRGKIIFSLFILIIIPLIVIVYRFYNSSMDIVQLQLYQANQAAVERKAQTMNEISVRMLKASSLILNDPETEKFLRQADDWINNYTSYNNLRNFQIKLNNIQLLIDSDAYLAFYDNRGYVHSTWAAVAKTDPTAFQKETWYQPTLQHLGSPNWQVPYAFDKVGYSQNLFVMTRLMTAELQSGYGTIFIGIPSDLFFYNETELSEQLSSGIHSLIISNDQLMLGNIDFPGNSPQVLLNPIDTESNGIKKITLGDQHYLVNEANIPFLGWKLVHLMNQKNFVSQLSSERNKSILWVVAWFLLFAVAFIILMIRFTSPFKHLVKSMNRVGKGDFNTTVQIKGGDEIAVLGKNFNKMVLHLQELIANLSEEQQLKQKAQFQALQAQINPHFLLNTLNSIKWMAILSGAEHVSAMITKLGKLLNYTMKNEEEFVTLREELAYLQVYISLQEIRYHDQIVFIIEVPEQLMDSEVLKFMLQPAVENSIIHGNRFPMSIEIYAQEFEGELLITLQDNGVGMSEEMIHQVKTQINQPNAKFSGIGIRNVNERIKLHFGAKYGIQIHSIENEGVQITLSLPQQRRESDDTNIDRG